MAIDYEKINSYLEVVNGVEITLDKYQELFDSERLIEFKQVTSTLKRNIEIAKDASRKLSVGIIGAVKAGKSSFLNACIFNGEEYLPKAATPMTAALTKITYSDTPKAIIHFYTEEDWETIKRHSDLYDKGLDKEYEDYCNKQRVKKISKEEYEKKYKCKSENQCGAKELTRMVKDSALLDELGGTKELDGDIIHILDDYVGVNGYYTPIVSYVELQVDNPYIKNLEIVDTPGLNDPIVSRGIRTKQFLRSCDVVLLLSPCSQFMDSQTVTLMANSLPNAGVREILVVGSKLDSGILNEDIKDFGVAYKKALGSYKQQFNRNLAQVKDLGRHIEILDKMSAETVLFVSSACFTIDRKIKNSISLDDNERKIYDNLHRTFHDFKDNYFASLGGMIKVKQALNEVLDRKNDIIEGKNANLLDDIKMSHLRILDKILQEITSSKLKLETVSAEELKHRASYIRNTINSSREKLNNIFDSVIIKCDKKVQNILPQLIVEMGKYKKIAVKTTYQDDDTVKTRFFGLKKETIHSRKTNHVAGTAAVVENIEMYYAKCIMFVNGEFDNIFNKEEFAQRIKNVVINAFNQGKMEFDEEDILLPLQNVFDKISIPHISFDYTQYIDEIETRFNRGYAENDEINKLDILQDKLLDKIKEEISEKVESELAEIINTLKEQAVHFADQIESTFCNELEKLQGQVEERKQYIKKYNTFADELRKIKMCL